MPGKVDTVNVKVTPQLPEAPLAHKRERSLNGIKGWG
jgi:hypothetical protein